MTRAEALAKIKTFQILPSMHYRFRNTVIAKGIDDMSVMIFDQAFFEKVEDYYFVFPEHHEYQIFHEDEYLVAEYKRNYDI